jgi:hypothetical protein
VELAAELAQTLPQHAPVLLEDVRDSCPALTTCKKGCACCKATKSSEQDPGPSSDDCREPTGPGPDDDGSSGPSAALTWSPGTSKAALPEVTGSNPRGGPN